MKGELRLHHYWKTLPENASFFDETGQRLTVVSPGSHNRSRGPDFLDAEIHYGDDSRKGDVEIHVARKDWERHGHHLDPRYNKVCLHVFLKGDGKPTLNRFGSTIPALRLEEAVIENFFANASNDDPFDRNAMGACGLLLADHPRARTQHLIQQVAKERLTLKAKAFSESFDEGTEPEESLYRKIFRSLGYGGYENALERIAWVYPYGKMKAALDRDADLALPFILARWFKSLGVPPEKIVAIGEEKLPRRLGRNVLSEMDRIGDVERVEAQPQKSILPRNPLALRVLWMGYHLRLSARPGLLPAWQRDFEQFGREAFPLLALRKKSGKPVPLPNESGTYKKGSPDRIQSELVRKSGFLLESIRSGFEPDFSDLPKTARIFSEKKALSVIVNTAIPFFIAYGERAGNDFLVKTAFEALFHLAPEGANRKTEAVEARLGLKRRGRKPRETSTAGKAGEGQAGSSETKNRAKAASNCTFGGKQRHLIKNLCYGQALVQIHDEFCFAFDHDCRRCELAEALRKD